MDYDELVKRLRVWSLDERRGDGMLLVRTADAITQLRAERDDAIRHLADWSSRCGRTETDLAAARALLRNIINLYNAYRRRGVAPAPIEYADVVRAIVRADAALAGKDAL